MVVFILIIAVIAIVFANYMLRREAARREEMHERRKERFSQLMGQLKKLESDKADTGKSSENPDNDV